MTDEKTVPAVFGALAVILKDLSVDKKGTLPGTMGGKPYITATDASAEVKKRFVENNLIFLPEEEVISNETVVHKERLNILVLIKGTYTIVSTVDGSSVKVSGTGDGLALSTAVASNIASTNAMKNALLRTFLITEQSVEDQGKSSSEPETAPALKKASGATKAPAKKSAPAGETPARKTIREDYVDAGKVDREIVNNLMKTAKEEGLSGDAVFEFILKKLEAGEVA